MSSLYILNNPILYQDCANQLQSDDGLLLIENAVLLASVVQSTGQRFVLSEDLIARGLESASQWKVINYDEFVALTLSFDKTITWL